MNNDDEEGCSYNTFIIILILILLALTCVRIGSLEDKLDHHTENTISYAK